MLLGNAYIEAAISEMLGKQIQSRPIRHRRSDRTNFIIPSGKIGQRLGKDLGIGWRV